MTDALKQAAQQALETIEALIEGRLFTAEWAGKHGAVINNLRSALAAPQAGPVGEAVATVASTDGQSPTVVWYCDFPNIAAKVKVGDKLYTAPQPAAPVAGLVELLRNALEHAKNGLLWYLERYPEATDGSDDEAMELIDAALAQSAAPDPEDKPLKMALESLTAMRKRAEDAEAKLERAFSAGMAEGFNSAQKAPAPESEGRMTHQRAKFFMMRFMHEEKLLGPNEQAALRHVIALLEREQYAAPAPERVPLTDEKTLAADAARWREMRRVFHVTENIGRTTGMPATKLSCHWHGWCVGDHADVTACVDALIAERAHGIKQPGSETP